MRKLIAGHELGARVSRSAADELTPEESFDAALDLWSLCPEHLGEPPDRLRVREVEEARAAWGKLKKRSDSRVERHALEAATEARQAAR